MSSGGSPSYFEPRSVPEKEEYTLKRKDTLSLHCRRYDTIKLIKRKLSSILEILVSSKKGIRVIWFLFSVMLRHLTIQLEPNHAANIIPCITEKSFI